MRRRLYLALAMLGVGSSLFAITAFASGQRPGVRAGGTFRVIGVDTGIDPALSTSPFDFFLQASCALLLRPPDRRIPGGQRLTPEVATGFPRVSRDGKTYTFTLRDSFRFSNGARLTPSSFAREIDRILSPQLESGVTEALEDIVGAQDVLAGRAMHAAGVRARGNTLVIRLAAPSPDFAARVSGRVCSVPPALPVDPEGIGAPLPAAGPYAIAQYVPGQRLVLKRNRFYRGRRPHHVDRIVASFVPFGGESDALTMVEKGQADWAAFPGGVIFDAVRSRVPAKKARLFVVPAFTMRYLVMNTSRGIFKNNPTLRRAVNFAIGRRALVQLRGGRLAGRPTDHYLPSNMPGFRGVRIYPLTHPDLRRARALARGHTRTGKAVFYAGTVEPQIAVAQSVRRDLRKIGIDVELKLVPPSALFNLVGTPGEPWDLFQLGWAPDFYDPASFLNSEFHGDYIGPGGGNFARFNSPKYNRLLARAARLSGTARYRAYGKLDVQLARDAAPLAAYMNENALTFVSKRTGCVVANPFLDLAAVCLKR